MFDDVDINTQIETRLSGQLAVQSLLVQGANRKTVAELSAEIRRAQGHDAQSNGGSEAPSPS